MLPHSDKGDTEELLLSLLAMQPANPYIHYRLANFYARNKGGAGVISRDNGNGQSTAAYLASIPCKEEGSSDAVAETLPPTTTKWVQDAVAHYKKAIQLAPDFGDAYNGLGLTYITEARKAAAVAAKQPVSTKGTKSEEELRWLHLAVDVFETAIVETKKTGTVYFSAMKNLARVQRDLGNLDAAESLLKELIAIDPNNSSAYWNLGSMLLEKAQTIQVPAVKDKVVAEAARLFQDCLRVDPIFYHAFVSLADVYQNYTTPPNHTLTLSMLESAANIAPSHGLHVRIGELYESMTKDLRAAKKHYELAAACSNSGKKSAPTMVTGGSGGGGAGQQRAADELSRIEAALQNRHLDPAVGGLERTPHRCPAGHFLYRVHKKPFLGMGSWACDRCYKSLGGEEAANRGVLWCSQDCNSDLCNECEDEMMQLGNGELVHEPSSPTTACCVNSSSSAKPFDAYSISGVTSGLALDGTRRETPQYHEYRATKRSDQEQQAKATSKPKQDATQSPHVAVRCYSKADPASREAGLREEAAFKKLAARRSDDNDDITTSCSLPFYGNEHSDHHIIVVTRWLTEDLASPTTISKCMPFHELSAWRMLQQLADQLHALHANDLVFSTASLRSTSVSGCASLSDSTTRLADTMAWYFRDYNTTTIANSATTASLKRQNIKDLIKLVFGFVTDESFDGDSIELLSAKARRLTTEEVQFDTTSDLLAFLSTSSSIPLPTECEHSDAYSVRAAATQERHQQKEASNSQQGALIPASNQLVSATRLSSLRHVFKKTSIHFTRAILQYVPDEPCQWYYLHLLEEALEAGGSSNKPGIVQSQPSTALVTKESGDVMKKLFAEMQNVACSLPTIEGPLNTSSMVARLRAKLLLAATKQTVKSQLDVRLRSLANAVECFSDRHPWCTTVQDFEESEFFTLCCTAAESAAPKWVNDRRGVEVYSVTDLQSVESALMATGSTHFSGGNGREHSSGSTPSSPTSSGGDGQSTKPFAGCHPADSAGFYDPRPLLNAIRLCAAAGIAQLSEQLSSSSSEADSSIVGSLRIPVDVFWDVAKHQVVVQFSDHPTSLPQLLVQQFCLSDHKESPPAPALEALRLIANHHVAKPRLSTMSLKELLKRHDNQPLPLAPALRILEGIGAALRNIHEEMGVAHGKINPSTVWVTVCPRLPLFVTNDKEQDTEPAVLLPNTSAKHFVVSSVQLSLPMDTLDASSSSGDTIAMAQSRATQAIRYLSPEQCAFEPATPSSDVWAAACCFLLMVQGDRMTSQRRHNTDASAAKKADPATAGEQAPNKLLGWTVPTIPAFLIVSDDPAHIKIRDFLRSALHPSASQRCVAFTTSLLQDFHHMGTILKPPVVSKHTTPSEYVSPPTSGHGSMFPATFSVGSIGGGNSTENSSTHSGKVEELADAETMERAEVSVEMMQVLYDAQQELLQEDHTGSHRGGFVPGDDVSTLVSGYGGMGWEATSRSAMLLTPDSADTHASQFVVPYQQHHHHHSHLLRGMVSDAIKAALFMEGAPSYSFPGSLSDLLAPELNEWLDVFDEGKLTVAQLQRVVAALKERMLARRKESQIVPCIKGSTETKVLMYVEGYGDLLFYHAAIRINRKWPAMRRPTQREIWKGTENIKIPFNHHGIETGEDLLPGFREAALTDADIKRVKLVVIHDNDLQALPATKLLGCYYQNTSASNIASYYHRLRFGRAIENYMIPVAVPVRLLQYSSNVAFWMCMEALSTFGKAFFSEGPNTVVSLPGNTSVTTAKLVGGAHLGDASSMARHGHATASNLFQTMIGEPIGEGWIAPSRTQSTFFHAGSWEFERKMIGAMSQTIVSSTLLLRLSYILRSALEGLCLDAAHSGKDAMSLISSRSFKSLLKYLSPSMKQMLRSFAPLLDLLEGQSTSFKVLKESSGITDGGISLTPSDEHHGAPTASTLYTNLISSCINAAVERRHHKRQSSETNNSHQRSSPSTSMNLADKIQHYEPLYIRPTSKSTAADEASTHDIVQFPEYTNFIAAKVDQQIADGFDKVLAAVIKAQKKPTPPGTDDGVEDAVRTKLQALFIGKEKLWFKNYQQFIQEKGLVMRLPEMLQQLGKLFANASVMMSNEKETPSGPDPLDQDALDEALFKRVSHVVLLQFQNAYFDMALPEMLERPPPSSTNRDTVATLPKEETQQKEDAPAPKAAKKSKDKKSSAPVVAQPIEGSSLHFMNTGVSSKLFACSDGTCPGLVLAGLGSARSPGDFLPQIPAGGINEMLKDTANTPINIAAPKAGQYLRCCCGRLVSAHQATMDKLHTFVNEAGTATNEGTKEEKRVDLSAALAAFGALSSFSWDSHPYLLLARGERCLGEKAALRHAFGPPPLQPDEEGNEEDEDEGSVSYFTALRLHEALVQWVKNPEENDTNTNNREDPFETDVMHQCFPLLAPSSVNLTTEERLPPPSTMLQDIVKNVQAKMNALRREELAGLDTYIANLEGKKSGGGKTKKA